MLSITRSFKFIKNHRNPFLKKSSILSQMSGMVLKLDSFPTFSSWDAFQFFWFEIRTLKNLFSFYLLVYHQQKWFVKMKFLLSKALLTTVANGSV